jgi:hypothetical protein
METLAQTSGDILAAITHLVGFSPNPSQWADAVQEKSAGRPVTAQPEADMVAADWVKLLPMLKEAARLLAIRKGGHSRLTPPEEAILRFLEEADLLEESTLMLACEQQSPPKHLAKRRMTLCFLANKTLAGGVACFDKQGRPILYDRMMMDSGANLLAIDTDVAANCPLPVEACNTVINTFGGSSVRVVGKIRDFPLGFALGTPWERVIRVTALVYSPGPVWKVLLGMPVSSHYQLNLWPCAHLGGVVMFPQLQHQDAQMLAGLKPMELAQHMGAMVVLPATMTEADSPHSSLSASIFQVTEDEPEDSGGPSNEQSATAARAGTSASVLPQSLAVLPQSLAVLPQPLTVLPQPLSVLPQLRSVLPPSPAVQLSVALPSPPALQLLPKEEVGVVSQNLWQNWVAMMTEPPMSSTGGASRTYGRYPREPHDQRSWLRPTTENPVLPACSQQMVHMAHAGTLLTPPTVSAGGEHHHFTVPLQRWKVTRGDQDFCGSMPTLQTRTSAGLRRPMKPG